MEAESIYAARIAQEAADKRERERLAMPDGMWVWAFVKDGKIVASNTEPPAAPSEAKHKPTSLIAFGPECRPDVNAAEALMRGVGWCYAHRAWCGVQYD